MWIVAQGDDLIHSAKGTTWKKHKYIRIENGRYIYPNDKREKENTSKKQSRLIGKTGSDVVANRMIQQEEKEFLEKRYSESHEKRTTLRRESINKSARTKIARTSLKKAVSSVGNQKISSVKKSIISKGKRLLARKILIGR